MHNRFRFDTKYTLGKLISDFNCNNEKGSVKILTSSKILGKFRFGDDDR